MIKIEGKIYYPIYEYFYLFVMVIYMAQMTPETGRMTHSLSGSLFPFLLPVVLTVILLFRHPVSFQSTKLWLLTGIMVIWAVAVCFKFNDFSSSNLSYYFFLIYAIFIAFIHIRVYGRDLFPVYEHIMVVMSLISLTLWSLYFLIPSVRTLFLEFPRTHFGNNVLYVYNGMNPAKGQIYGSIIRNAGCSWEPGRFAIMLIPAILINLSRRGVTFHGNKKIVILLFALASTMSTTGYSIAILLYVIYWFNEFDMKKAFSFIFLILPITVYIFSLDFMGDKIQRKADVEGLTYERIQRFNYNEMHYEEYLGALDRFDSASFDWMNFQEEPLLGYGRNVDYSWFRQNISRNYALTGGFVKLFSQYGVFVAIFLYVILLFSSVKISRLFPYQQRFAIAIAIILSSISYTIFIVPLFTAFWLYGLFCENNDRPIRRLKPRTKRLIIK